MQRDGAERNDQIAHPRDINERCLAHHSNRRCDFGEQQERKRAVAADEITPRPDQAHQCFPRNTKRERNPGLRGDNPKADLADLGRNCGAVSLFKFARDDWAKHWVKASFELLRQRGDLLCHPVNPHCCWRNEQTEDHDINSARSPLNRIGKRKRRIVPRQRVKFGDARRPAFGQAVALEERND